VYNSRGMRAGLAGAENLFDLNGNIVSVVTPGTATLAYNRYTVGGRLLAANLSGTTDFYHQDWLGGIRAGSSLSGSLIDSCTNLPFGDGTNYCGLWYFAGLMSDPWDTLNTSATRSQSPASGRWLTPDPAGMAAVDLSNPQSWNRYAYVLNNPVSFIDPLGLDDCAYDACVTATYPTVPLEVLNIGGVPGTGPGGGLIQVPGTTVNVRATAPPGPANNCINPNVAQQALIKGLSAAANWTNKTIGVGVGASYGIGFGQGFGFAGTLSAQLQISPGGSASLAYTWGGSGLTQDWLTPSSFGASFIVGPQVSVSSGPPSPGPGADVAVSGVYPVRGAVGPGASLDVNGSADGVTGTLTGGAGAGIVSGSAVATQTAVVQFCTGG